MSVPIRKEVEDFLKASETLLSPALRQSELSPEECLLIADYVMSLSDPKTPWGTSISAASRIGHSNT